MSGGREPDLRLKRTYAGRGGVYDVLRGGANWIHEIKHDGYPLMARRDPVGIRLLTRNGNDWSNRFPLVVEQ